MSLTPDPRGGLHKLLDGLLDRYPEVEPILGEVLRGAAIALGRGAELSPPPLVTCADCGAIWNVAGPAGQPRCSANGGYRHDWKGA